MRTLLALASLLVFAASTSFAEPQPATLKVTGYASFDGDSTATKFHGDCGETAKGTLTVEAGNVTGWVSFPLASCKTGKDGRDEHMQKAFETAKYPDVKLTIKPTKLAAWNAPVNGVLTIKADSAPAFGNCLLGQGEAGAWLADCDLEVDLLRYPSVSMAALANLAGLLKVEPAVKVRVELRASPAP